MQSKNPMQKQSFTLLLPDNTVIDLIDSIEMAKIIENQSKPSSIVII